MFGLDAVVTLLMFVAEWLVEGVVEAVGSLVVWNAQMGGYG